MKKRYLFLIMLLFPLATILTSNSVHAQTDEEYDAAMAAITDGATYYIATDVDGVRCYLTSDGFLAYDKLDAGMFTFKKTSGGEFKTYGWYLDGGTGNYFSNPAASNSIGDTKINTHSISSCRTTWEAQVFFLNENGKFAVRATNAAPTTSTSGWNWVGQSFWAVNEGPSVGYSFDVNYIWELELPSDKNQIWTVLNSIVVDYDQQVWDDEEGNSMNIGTEFGQRTDVETWQKFWNLLQKVYHVALKLMDEDYDIDTDPDAPTLEWANQVRADADSMYQKILDSERPYMIPQDGYYRIISRLRYSSTASESGYVDKAFAASISADHKNKGVYATINRDKANFIWKLTQHGDSIEIQNAGMGTYISFSSPKENRVIMTDSENDRSHMVFDYAGSDFVETDEDAFEKDIFYIRLAGKPRGGSNYFHQLSHGGKSDIATMSGNSGTDTGKEMDLSFWAATFNKGTDKGTSEWYLEYVPEEEAQALIEAFAYIRDHDVLVEKNNALRAKVKDALLVAKDSVRTTLINDASQMSSPYSHNDINNGSRDGGDLSAGVLIDGDKTTYWHSSWGALANEGPHYIQLSSMENMVGNCELYLCQRTADNDHPAEFTLYGSDDPEADDWEEMVVIRIPNTGSGQENTIPFVIEKAYPYVRIAATDCIGKSYGNRNFWHAAELQISTVQANPNSQFVALGKVAETLDRIYSENAALTDEDITPEAYEALFNAYEAFLKAMVDPTELRNALATYANLTQRVVEGTDPGTWPDKDIATAFDALYKEVEDYNEAGRFTAAQNHKYAIMLKAMAKSVMECANGIKTDKWYHITFPTEAMYDEYGFDKSGGAKSGLIDEQAYQWGNIVVVGKEVSEDVPNPEDEEATVTQIHLESLESADIREGSRMFFIADDEITDKDASLFRFVEREADPSNYTEPFSEVKENMSMALDMSTTYKRGNALITDASQLSSNAPDASEGQHIEYAVDDNPNTFWHSDYHKEYLEPAYLQVALNEPVSGLIQVDVTRRQNSAYGHIVRMYILGSNDAENWTKVGYLEVPYTNMNESVTCQPVDLGGTYSHLRFILTHRAYDGGAAGIEFDPFAVITSADQYDKVGGWTYFHVAEFQIYPVTPEKELSESGKALQQAFSTANKVILKDATAEDFSAAVQAYRAYQTEFNNSVGKAVLPNGTDKATPSYAIQNKATGLFVNAKQSNTNDVFLKIVPTLFTYEAPGYQRSLLRGTNLDGTDCTWLHSGNTNHRFCTWNANTPGSNSGLVIREVEAAQPEEFTFYRDIKPGRIYAWCAPVTIIPQDDSGSAVAYTPLGQYSVEDEGVYLALKQTKTLEAGQPAFYIYGDTTSYSAEDETTETIKFTMKAEPDFVYEGATVNGVIGSLVNHTLKEHEIYFSGNHAVCIGSTGYYLSGPCVALGLDNCPKADSEGDYDFSIFLGVAAEDAGGIIDGIEPIHNSQFSNFNSQFIYDLSGRKIVNGKWLNGKLPKGIYIHNGKKLLINK